MKYKSLIVIFYIILLLFILRFFYYLYIHHKKNILIQQIIENWKERTGGIVENAYSGIYTDDYFLFFSNNHDKKNHIHLITNHFYSNYEQFIQLFFKPNFQIIPTVTIGYVIKKNDSYLPPMKINLNNDAQAICYYMIKSFKKLEMY
jgi:hypothetical protein